VECFRERDFVVEGFAEEEVDVLGHDDVAEDFAVVTPAGEFEGVEEVCFLRMRWRDSVRGGNN
jgi:hypothetical protein